MEASKAAKELAGSLERALLAAVLERSALGSPPPMLPDAILAVQRAPDRSALSRPLLAANGVKDGESHLFHLSSRIWRTSCQTPKAGKVIGSLRQKLY